MYSPFIDLFFSMRTSLVAAQLLFVQDVSFHISFFFITNRTWSGDFQLFDLSMFFAFSQAIESGNPLKMLQSLFGFTVWAIIFYFFCDSGDEVSRRFEGISDAIYDCSWYEMPIKMRKSLLIMMCISQKPITIQGSNTLCNRRQFPRVRSNSCCFVY